MYLDSVFRGGYNEHEVGTTRIEQKDMDLFKLAAIGLLLLVNTPCWGAVDLKDIAPLIEKSASPESRITEEEKEVARQVHDLGPAAISHLLPLLKHKNGGVLKLTSHILCYMEGLTEEHLDALIESRLQGNEAIAPTIARIATPRAIAFLMDELKKEKRTDTPLTWAFYILGEEGVSSLVRLIESEPLDDELVAAIIYVFDGWKDKAEAAVEPLANFLAARRGGQRAMKCAVLALGKIGRKAQHSVPTLLKLAQDEPNTYRRVVDDTLLAMEAPEAITGLLQRFGEGDRDRARVGIDRLMHRRELLVDPLMEFISGRQGSEQAMKRAVWILGSIGPEAQRSVPIMLKLAEENPGSYREVVDEAVLSMKAPQALPGVLRRLKEKPDRFFLLEVAMLGETGRDAGPALVRCLEHDDWDVRIGAARALGYVGYTEAGPHLIKVLGEDDDWRQVFVSAKSLGRLRVPEAVGPLTKLSNSHWYPPVREAAQKAIGMITGQATYDSRDDRSGMDFVSEFSDYMLVHAPRIPSSVADGQRDAGQAHVRPTDSLDKTQLAKLAFKEPVPSFRVGKDGRSTEKYIATLERIPQVGITVGNGYLVGWNEGEFGGGFLFIDRTGNRTVLLNENTQGIYRMASGVVAVAGLDHLSYNNGIIFKVSQRSDGSWLTNPWKALPGAPQASSMLANGNLWINCSNGCVEISPAGDIKMAPNE